jgi:hypothetical protein
VFGGSDRGEREHLLALVLFSFLIDAAVYEQWFE